MLSWGPSCTSAEEQGRSAHGKPEMAESVGLGREQVKSQVNACVDTGAAMSRISMPWPRGSGKDLLGPG